MLQGMVAPQHAGEAFATYWSFMFPWMKIAKAQAEVKIQEAMKTWTAMGPLQFSVVGQSPLHTKAKQMQIPDEFKAKLRERTRKKL